MNNYSPIAFCSRDGVFTTDLITVSDNSTFVSLGSRVSCPKCGQMSEMLPGSYKKVGDRLNLLLDPSITPEALEALKNIAERLQRNEITSDQAEEEAGKLSSKFRDLFKGITQETVAVLAAAIIGAAVQLYAAKTSSNPTVNNFYFAPPVSVSETVSSVPKFSTLPEIGPRPNQKPKPANRYERRKLKSMSRHKT